MPAREGRSCFSLVLVLASGAALLLAPGDNQRCRGVVAHGERKRQHWPMFICVRWNVRLRRNPHHGRWLDFVADAFDGGQPYEIARFENQASRRGNCSEMDDSVGQERTAANEGDTWSDHFSRWGSPIRRLSPLSPTTLQVACTQHRPVNGRIGRFALTCEPRANGTCDCLLTLARVRRTMNGLASRRKKPLTCGIARQRLRCLFQLSRISRRSEGNPVEYALSIPFGLFSQDSVFLRYNIFRMNDLRATRFTRHACLHYLCPDEGTNSRPIHRD